MIVLTSAAPMALAARTYSCSFSERTMPRMTLAMPAQPIKLMIKTMMKYIFTLETSGGMAALKDSMIPDDIHYKITRNYGETANDKVNSLVKSLAEAVITVIALITFYMGWRTGTIVAIAVPITYSLVLLFNYMFGYTINRVTLFALILALGLVVDDPIVSVENIYRHLTMGGKKKLKAI